MTMFMNYSNFFFTFISRGDCFNNFAVMNAVKAMNIAIFMIFNVITGVFSFSFSSSYFWIVTCIWYYRDVHQSPFSASLIWCCHIDPVESWLTWLQLYLIVKIILFKSAIFVCYSNFFILIISVLTIFFK